MCFMHQVCLSINLAYCAANSKSQWPVDGLEDLDEETARVIAVEWINTADPDDKSDLLQNMDDLDVAVLITSNLDGDLKGKIPTVSDFRIGQHQN